MNQFCFHNYFLFVESNIGICMMGIRVAWLKKHVYVITTGHYLVCCLINISYVIFNKVLMPHIIYYNNIYFSFCALCIQNKSVSCK